jgi:hypothetical protein
VHDPGIVEEHVQFPERLLGRLHHACALFGTGHIGFDGDGLSAGARNGRDGIFCGTALKVDGNTWNAVDPERAKEFMRLARAARGH